MTLISTKEIQYYTFEGISIIQQQMLKLLKIVDEICRENDIKYFIEAGTAIGQLRHGGFIPWDDDLDISIIKPDYLKLVSILKKLDKKQFFLFDYSLTQHSCTYFGEKIAYFAGLNNEKNHLYPIKIDIRPLNAIKNTPEALHENRIFREIANKLLFSKCSEQYEEEAKKVYKDVFKNNRNHFFKFYNYEYGLYTNNDLTRLAHPYMEYTTPTTYSINDIYPLREVEFCDMKTFIANTDIILRDAYGDYMQLPELEKRRPEANIAYKVKHYKILYPYLIRKRTKTIPEKIIFYFLTNLMAKQTITGE